VSDYGRAKYALDDRSRRLFLEYLISQHHNEMLCHLAVGEAMDHGKCRTCNGRKWVQLHERRIVCSACEGTGELRWDGELRRRLLGVSKKRWDKMRKEYENIIRDVMEIEYILWVGMTRE